MNSISKVFSLFVIVVILVTSISMVKLAIAQVGVTTPARPNFGVEHNIFLTDVPPTYGVDPSTGKAVVIQEGYTGVDETVYVRIVNQPFIPYKDSTGNNIQLFYSIRWLEPSNNSWVDPVRTTQAPNEEFTVCTFEFMGNYHKVSHGLDIPIGSETDFQVEASIGYYTADDVFVGKTSGWTNPQAITHAPNYTPSSTTPTPSETSPTDSQKPTATPEAPEFLPWIIFAAALLVTATLAGVFAFRRRARSKATT